MPKPISEVKAQENRGPGIKLFKLRAFACVCVALSCSAVWNAGAAPPADIVIQPTNQIGAVFGTATFSVTAESALPLSYQWYFNGEAMANETNSVLILGPLGYSESGYYNAVVSNMLGAVSSPKAQLAVSEAIVSTGYRSTDIQNFLLQFTNLVAVDANSYGVVFGLDADGAVVCDSPSAVPAGLSDVVAISISDIYGLAALNSDGTTVALQVPSGPSNVAAIASGIDFDLALRNDGTVVVWGSDFGAPASVPVPLPWSNVVAIATGGERFGAVYADGTAFESGGMTNEASALSNVIAIAPGGVSLALRSDGTVVGWDGLPTNPLPNVSNVVAIAAQGAWFLALESDGTVVGSSFLLDQFPFVPSNVFSIFLGYPSILLCNDGSPVITVQPGNQAPANGGTAWLHARAVGAQPMRYQWQFDGISIPGATNADLTLTNMQEERIGQYSALVSNRVGSAKSRLASLMILSIPSSYTLAQALDATNLPWSTFGNAAWFAETTITQDGIAAAQSGRITNSTYSELQTTVTGPGTLTFWWMVSSEEFFDVLSFYIGTGTNYAARISGEVDWEQETFLIGPGSQTLSWIYAKDPDISLGLDAGWLDQVRFIPGLPAQLGVPALLSDGSLLFDVYTTNGSILPLSNPSSVLFEASSNLVDWIPLTNALTLTNGSALLRDPAASNTPARFYRLLRQ
jgi:hypothetical protein